MTGFDRPSVRLGYVLADGQAKPGAASRSRPAAFHAIEPIEQALELLIADTGSRIFQNDAGLMVVGFKVESHGSAFVRVPAAVFQ